jgi:hypothetical protein
VGSTAGQADAANIQAAQAQHATDLFNIGSPGMQLALGDFMTDLGSPGQIPQSVQTAFQKMSSLTDQQFGQEEAAAPATINQQMKSSGYRGAQGAEGYSASQTLGQLEQNRLGAQNQLQVQEVNQGLSQQSYDLSNIFGIISGTESGSNMFAQNALQATGADQQNPWGGAAAGALSGAATGAAAGGGWGALLGGVIGGASGYFGGGH